MPLSIETLRELAKLTELKSKGGIPVHHFDLLKQHIKQTGTLTREAWEVFGLAWNLKVDAVLTEEEYAEQIEEGVTSILSSRVASALPSGPDGAPQAAGARSPAGSKKTRKTKKAAVGDVSAKKRAAAGSADGSNANAGSTGPVKRVKRTAKASSPSKVPCSMCSCTFANRQGLGMHTKAMHGDGQAREGVRLKGMPGNGGGRAVLPWDTAGPGRCWTVQFNHPAPGSSYSSAPNSAAKFVLKRKGLVKTELEEGLVTPDRAKQTRGASTRKRYTFRQKASVISNLRMLEGLSKEIWASDKLTPQQLLEAQTKIHHSLISKWAKDEENIVLRAGQEGAAALLEEVRTGMEASS